MNEHPTLRKFSKFSSTALLFLVLLIALLGFQLLIYLEYNLTWVDSDQFFMWTGLVDFASGKFYEPRYYGQNYNTFMEALFAVPFYKAGLAAYQALPLATTLIFLFPIITSSAILYRANKKWQSLIFLSFILCMNPAYFLLNAQPRGFVTGLFCCSFYLISILKPTDRKWLFINTSAGIIAYFINPNSLLLTVPLLAYLFFHNFKHRWYYLYSISSALFYLPFDFFFNQFYRDHPNYVKTGIILDFNFNYLIANLSNFDTIFAHISPFEEKKSIFLIVAGFLLLIALICQKRQDMLLAYLVFLMFLTTSMCLGKTRDGSVWPYLSYSRMYLGIPLLLALILGSLQIRSRWIAYSCAAIALVTVALNFFTQKNRLSHYFETSQWHAPVLIKLTDALDAITFYQNKCKEQDVKFLLVSHRFWAVSPLCAGKAVSASFPDILDLELDKRYYVREAYEKKIIPKFALLSGATNIVEKMSSEKGFCIRKIDDYGLAIVTGNTLSISEFSRLVLKYERPN